MATSLDSGGQRDRVSLAEAFREWLGVGPDRNTYFDILGIPRGELDPQVIRAAYNARIAVLKNRIKGAQGDLARRCALYVKKAAETLLDPQKASRYLKALEDKQSASSDVSSRHAETRKGVLSVLGGSRSWVGGAIAMGTVLIGAGVAAVMNKFRSSSDVPVPAAGQVPAVTADAPTELAQAPQPVPHLTVASPVSIAQEPETRSVALKDVNPTPSKPVVPSPENVQAVVQQEVKQVFPSEEAEAVVASLSLDSAPVADEQDATMKSNKKKKQVTVKIWEETKKEENTSSPTDTVDENILGISVDNPVSQSPEQLSESVLAKMMEYRSHASKADFRNKLVTPAGRSELMKQSPDSSHIERISYYRLIEESALQYGDLPTALDAYNILAVLPTDVQTMQKYAEENLQLLTRYFGTRREISVQQYVVSRSMPTLLYAAGLDKTERVLPSMSARISKISPEQGDQLRHLQSFMKKKLSLRNEMDETEGYVAGSGMNDKAGLYHCMSRQYDQGLPLLAKADNGQIRALAQQMQIAQRQGDHTSLTEAGKAWAEYAKSLGENEQVAFIPLIDECYRRAMHGASPVQQKQMEKAREGLLHLRAGWLYAVPDNVKIDLLQNLAKKDGFVKIEGITGIRMERTNQGQEPVLAVQSSPTGKGARVLFPISSLKRLPMHLRYILEFERQKGLNDIMMRMPIAQNEDGSVFELVYILEHKASKTGAFETGFKNLGRFNNNGEQILMQDFNASQTGIGIRGSLKIEVHTDVQSDSIAIDAIVFSNGKPTKIHTHFVGRLSELLSTATTEMVTKSNLAVGLMFHDVAATIHTLSLESIPENKR
ncbi:MAG: hypothetical protein PHW10_00870 [Candidatus Peribacteraceae bacterium]|nr:hypothetical protein [Candidatus Peribacteraceae bacterium]